MARLEQLINWTTAKLDAALRNPVYPLLFSIYPVLFLYQHNIDELTIDVIFVPLVSAIATASFLLLILNVLFHDWYKSALLALILLAIFYYLDPLVDLLPLQLAQWGPIEIRRGMLMQVAMAASLVWLVCALWKSSSRRPRALSRPLNIAVEVLLLLVLVPIVNTEAQRIISQDDTLGTSNASFMYGTLANAGTGSLPDVYYLIFDKHASNRSLLNYYDFDNTAFHDELRDRGFFVADKSKANYPSTIFSLSSSLNMNYIQGLVDMSDPSLSVGTTLNKLFNQNAVGRLFEENGYRYYHLGNWYAPTRSVEIASKNLVLADTAKGHNFAVKLLGQTLYKHASSFFSIKPVGSISQNQREILNFQFESIRQIPLDERPTFTVLHALLPHDPFVFDADCNDIPILGVAYSTSNNYLEHVKCADKKVIELVDYILENSKEPPVIIFQSDEGSRQYVDGKENPKIYQFDGASDDYLLERTGIQNAYYFPDGDYSGLYSTISPVNSFRVVLNKYLGYSFNLLPEMHYVFPDKDHMFNFIDATDRLRHLDEQGQP